MMMDRHEGCFSHIISDVNTAELSYCKALQQLREEHGPLRSQLHQFHALADKIGRDNSIKDWQTPLAQLRDQAEKFIAELDPHSEREEGLLFPAIAKYIGKETGPIAVMEYEHDQAKKNLKLFMDESNMIQPALDSKEARRIVSYLVEAYHILTDHFMKEENVLFPMAEKLLNEAEKQQLWNEFQE